MPKRMNRYMEFQEMSDSLIRDFEQISQSSVDWELFKGKSFLVTGATGLIGSLFINSLLYVSAQKNLDIRMIAMVRNLEKAKKLFGDNTSLSYCIHDFTSNDDFVVDSKVDYIVHTAAVTVSKEMITYPVENIKTSIFSTMQMMDYAIKNSVSGMVYLSSMEAYGQMNVTDHLVTENELGVVDLTKVRSCYPEGKRMCECLCAAYASESDLNVCTARLAQTFGPGISKNENRVFAQFAKSAIEGKDIVLHTRGTSEGNYVYTADAITAILTILSKGEKGQTYNVVNEANHMTIRQMAEMVSSKIANGGIKVIFDIPEDESSTGYAATTKMHMSSNKLNQLGWKANVDLEHMYLNLIQYMKED